MAKMIYGINEKPPLRKAIPLAFQQVIITFTAQVGLVLVLASGFGMDVYETSILMQSSFLIVGVSTLIHTYGMGKYIGSKLPIVSLSSFTPVATLIVAAADPDVGVAGAFGSACVASAVMFLFGPWMIKKLHRYFRPALTGSVILAVGLCITVTGFYNFNPTSPDVGIEFGFGIGVIVLILALYFFGKGIVKQCCVLFGMMGVYLIMIVIGRVDLTPIVEADWFFPVLPFAFGFKVDWGVVLTIAIINIGTIMEMTGDISALTATTMDRLPTKEELATSMRAGGIGSAFATMFNGPPITTGSGNVAAIAITRVASRSVMLWCGIMVIVFSFMPKLSQFLSLMPASVIGGAVIIMYAQIAIAGIKVIAMDTLDDRIAMILTVSVGFGLVGAFATSNLSFLPPVLVSMITGIPGTAIIGLLLNIIIPDKNKDKDQAETVDQAETTENVEQSTSVEQSI